MDLVSGPPFVVGVVLWSSALDMGFWANRVKVTCTSPWQQCILCRLNTQSSTYYSSPYDVVDYLETKGNAWSPDFSSLWRRYICMVCVCVFCHANWIPQNTSRIFFHVKSMCISKLSTEMLTIFKFSRQYFQWMWTYSIFAIFFSS